MEEMEVGQVIKCVLADHGDNCKSEDGVKCMFHQSGECYNHLCRSFERGDRVNVVFLCEWI
jgi:hypothetical protein